MTAPAADPIGAKPRRSGPGHPPVLSRKPVSNPLLGVAWRPWSDSDTSRSPEMERRACGEPESLVDQRPADEHATTRRKERRRGTISRILYPTPPANGTAPSDDHSSSPTITGGVEQPTRRLRTGRPQTPPYLVLLRAGFSLPSALRRTRCALTAPFHPYLSTRTAEAGLTRGGVFSVPLSFRSP